MKKKSFKVSILFALFLSLICTVKEPVYAAQTQGTISIKLNQELGSKEGVEFSIYRVAEWNSSNGQWNLANDLSSTEFSNLNKASDNSAWISAANDLASHIKNASTSAVAKITTIETGETTAQNLGLGMYLVIQEGNNNYGTIEPFLISLPYKDTNGYNYSPTAYPKATAFPPSKGNTPSGNSSPAQSSTSNTNQGESTAPSGQSNETATLAEADIEETEPITTPPVTDKQTNKNDTPILDNESESQSEANEADNEEATLQGNDNDITNDEPDIQESNESDADDNTSSEKGINPITITLIATGITAAASSGGFIFFKLFRKK